MCSVGSGLLTRGSEITFLAFPFPVLELFSASGASLSSSVKAAAVAAAAAVVVITASFFR